MPSGIWGACNCDADASSLADQTASSDASPAADVASDSHTQRGLDAKNNACTPSADSWYGVYGSGPQAVGIAALPTKDGGVAVAGTTSLNSAGKQDFWLIKAAPDGAVEWQQTYGNKGNEGAWAIAPTIEGGFLLAGNTYSTKKGDADFWVVRTGKDGAKIWAKTFDSSVKNSQEEAWGVAVDGTGFIVAGSATTSSTDGFGGRDVWLVRINGDGSKAWAKRYGGKGNDLARAIAAPADGKQGFGVVGSEAPSDTQTHLVVKRIAANGDLIWSKLFNHNGGGHGRAVTAMEDGFVAAGQGGAGSLVVRVDSAGNQKWQIVYEPAGTARDTSGVAFIGDVVYVSGSTWAAASSQKTSNVFIARLGATGNFLNEQQHGGSKSEFAHGISQAEESLFTVGYTKTLGSSLSMLVVRTDKDGKVACNSFAGK